MVLWEKKNFLSAPEPPIFLGILCGCAAEYGAVIFLLVLCAVWSFCFNRRFFYCLAGGFLAGCLALCWHSLDEKVRRQELPDRDMRISLQCLCVDTRISHAADLPKPDTFRARIRQAEGKTLERGPEILVRVRKTAELPRYGETFSGTGILTVRNRDERFEQYLHARRLDGFWEPETLEITARAEKWDPGAAVCRFRDAVLEKVLRNVRSDKVKIIVGTMFFGTTGGFDSRMKQVYLRSGTLHLFSVSGMHLGAAAFLLLFFLRNFPLKIRYISLGLLAAVYAFSAGANPPVMRALLVLWGWCAGKIFFFRKTTLSLLALTGSILLLFSPFLIFDVGAQYSFFITAILILVCESCSEARQKEVSFFKNIPLTPRTGKILRRIHWRWKIYFLCGCSLAAFAAGIGISAAHGNLILPGMVILNLILCLLVPPLFLLTGLRLLPGELLPAGLFEKALLLLDGLCAEGSECFFPWVPAVRSGAEALLFSLLLFLAVRAGKWRHRLLFLLPAAGVLGLWALRPCFMPPTAVFISGDSETLPGIILADPPQKRAWAINVPDRFSADAAIRFLNSCGIGKLETLFFVPETSAAAFAAGLCGKMPVRRVVLPRKNAGAIRQKLFSAEVKNIVHEGTERENIKIFKEKSTYRLEYFDPGSTLRLCINWCDTAQGRLLSFNKEPPRCIPWKYLPEVLTYEFRKK